jgi:fatty acid desaturase
MKSPRGKILRYTIDRYTVGFVVLLFGLQLCVWRWATPMVAVVLCAPLLMLSMSSACVNHNHQHVNVFRSPWLNRLFELPLALQTGIGPYTWVLHHNLGHHLNYLQQRAEKSGVDESRWMRRDGTQMGHIEYTLHLFFTHQLDVFRVGRKHPRQYRNYLLMRIPLWTLLGVLFWLNPVNTLIVFVAMPMLTLLHTCSATYLHHSGLETDDHLHASRNRLNKAYNLMSQNLGYHTAHHMRPGLHWSELPNYHAQIEAGIPEAYISPKFW